MSVEYTFISYLFNKTEETSLEIHLKESVLATSDDIIDKLKTIFNIKCQSSMRSQNKKNILIIRFHLRGG